MSNPSKAEMDSETTPSGELTAEIRPASASDPETISNREAEHAGKAIEEIKADPDYVHHSAEHLEVRAIRKLVEWGWDLRAAEVAIRARLY